MTEQDFAIIENRIDKLTNELDKVLAEAHVRIKPIDKVLNALERYGNLTWHSLLQYTKLRADALSDALSVLMLDNKRVGQRNDEGVRFYYLKRAA